MRTFREVFSPDKLSKGLQREKVCNTNDIENFLTLNSINMKCQFKFALFNPLNPKNDQLLISSYNITPESNMKATRINKRNGYKLKKFLIFKQTLLVSTFGNV